MVEFPLTINQNMESFVAYLLAPHSHKFHRRTNQSRKKLRGLKRYYQKVHREAQSFVPELSVGHWYDFWHYHADWPGYGDLRWKHRKAHLAALYTVFGTFIRYLDEYYQPFQLWLYLDRDDAGQDAIYFHTPNPNGEQDHFPYKLTDITWGLPTMEEFFTRHLELPLRAGVEKRANGNCVYYVYSPAHGEALE